ncbi:hypothetical protein JCM3766R1_004706 [Sporobolomyces carnicolor]
MSNKQVPAVYRTIIDDVVHHVRPEFEQIGVEEAVLQELLRLWELKLAQSRVADFANDDRMGPVAQQFPPLTPEQVALNQQLVLQRQKDDEAAAAKIKKEEKMKQQEAGQGGGDDEDAINSDLDSSEDELDEEQELAGQGAGDDQGGDIVIALYEKVQRVKNKWKVTLKDGLISVNGKDYLFSKCNGEFEW